MVVCLTLGFVSAVVVYLPAQLKARGLEHPIKRSSVPKLATILPKLTEESSKKKQPRQSGGPIFRFVPEPDPAPPAGNVAAGLLSSNSATPKTDIEFEIDLDAARSVQHKTSSLVDGSAGRATSRGKRWWTTPRGLEIEVNFWKDVYSKYNTSQEVLHDPDYLQIIYGVLDFSETDNNPKLTKDQKIKIKRSKIEKEQDRIESMLKRLAKNPDAALRTRLGKKIARLFATVDEPDKFKKARERGVRAQTGQRDRFIEGLKRSGAYLGEIELIFKSHGLPRELTRLVFVESMFQINAHSKAGAAGIWQFMPGTGRKYLRINRFIDERLDPILATHAAAKLLKHNYDVLGTWPLAINAYNAGRGRLAQAVKQLGTTDIGTIIKRFDHRVYGFASRNFFLEFVAAKEIVDNAERYFGRIEYDGPLNYDVIDLPFHISLTEVAALSSTPMEMLIELNPALDEKVLSGLLPVPMGTTIRVPDNQGGRFLQLASRGRKTNRDPLTHRVSRGESVAKIARMYGVSESSIREANPRLKKRKPRRGQRLYIPFD